MKSFLVSCAIILSVFQSTYAGNYAGNNILIVLVANKNSQQFKEFKDAWQLDMKYENAYRGIKISVDDNTGRVKKIALAGENMPASGVKFTPCSAQLPFGILLTDDMAALEHKLGDGEKIPGKNSTRFFQHSIAVDVTFTATGKISFLEFYMISATAPIGDNKAGKTSEKSSRGVPAFKKAILDVFAASKQSGFYSIKSESRKDANFWNYKYTYNTKLKIPGEKYNMLYSFPFVNSELDFVVVLKEADVYDQSFEQTYHAIEKQLMEYFPKSEGWTGACLPNNNKAKLSNLEIRNDDYGSVILDYSKNPKGRHVLLLRFLLYS
ncbi:MAG: hypothetical protein JWO06_1316 [Bacteroidota bacterium]|nr:hypothetical protein [Bacteroidota bacterium]